MEDLRNLKKIGSTEYHHPSLDFMGVPHNPKRPPKLLKKKRLVTVYSFPHRLPPILPPPAGATAVGPSPTLAANDRSLAPGCRLRPRPCPPSLSLWPPRPRPCPSLAAPDHVIMSACVCMQHAPGHGTCMVVCACACAAISVCT